MGFFKALRNIALGKPVFTALVSAAKPEDTHISTNHAGPKPLPRLYIERVECREEGARMDVDCFIMNASAEPLELTEITILGRNAGLETYLRAGEMREFRVYTGQRPHETSDNMAHVHFKDETGDYFRADHWLDFRRLPDGTYTINRVRQSAIVDE